MLKRGSRVILITDVHGTSSNNPVQGSEYACEGIVTQINNPKKVNDFNVAVDWDNGNSNVYAEENLEVVNAGYKTIW